MKKRRTYGAAHFTTNYYSRWQKGPPTTILTGDGKTDTRQDFPENEKT